MRRLGLVCCLALFTGTVAVAADIKVKGRVVSRDPDKPLVPPGGSLDGFLVRVTQPGRGTLHVSDRQKLTPASGATSVDFEITIPTLALGTRTEVVMTFDADGRVPARLELAGNQDQTLVLVLPIEPTPPPPVEVVPYPCPPMYVIPYCPPARHRLFGGFRR